MCPFNGDGVTLCEGDGEFGQLVLFDEFHEQGGFAEYVAVGVSGEWDGCCCTDDSGLTLIVRVWSLSYRAVPSGVMGVQVVVGLAVGCVHVVSLIRGQ